MRVLKQKIEISKRASNILRALVENEKTNAKRLTPLTFSKAIGTEKLSGAQIVLNELIDNDILDEHLELTSFGRRYTEKGKFKSQMQ